MRYQHKWQDVPMGEVPAEGQANLEACIRRALELGINHIETARGYGSSERQLGQILPKLPREKMIVQTKVAPTQDPGEFVKDFEDSLARLGLGQVDLLALHGVNNEEILDWSIRPGGCLAKAREIQKRGLARHVGLSTHASTEVILEAVKHEKDGGFDYVNLHWYYIFQRNWPAIVEATKRDMGVFIISPSDKGGMLYDPPAKLVELCRPVHPMVFNDLFCLMHPQVHTLSIGAARPGDFDRHVEAVGMLGKAAEMVPPIVERLERAMGEAVERELRDPYAMGLPRWEDTPGEVNIPAILWLRNLVKAYDMVKYGQMRYNLLGNAEHWFAGKRADRLDEGALEKVVGKRVVEMLKETHGMVGGEEVKRLSQSE
jgi:hypothetical protein